MRYYSDSTAIVADSTTTAITTEPSESPTDVYYTLSTLSCSNYYGIVIVSTAGGAWRPVLHRPGGVRTDEH